ncbi:MAG: pyruvate kinase [Proteobacteria bacterium]|nr:pyruvate kinase [Pseudomonadota bacterium]
MVSTAPATLFERLHAELCSLRTAARAYAAQHSAAIAAAGPDYRDSAANLLHYLSLRQHDLRPLQDALVDLGLSSLGRSEAHVMAALEALLGALQRLGQWPAAAAPDEPSTLNHARGRQLLDTHTAALLGAAPAERAVRIMVTMPGAAADDATLIPALLAAGMDIMRINAAHDEPAAWQAMVARLRAAEQHSGRRCKVQLDLAGPKLRTGALHGTQRVARFGPLRDECGAVLRPAMVWLTAADAPAPPPQAVDCVLPLSGDVLRDAACGDALEIQDCRWRHRKVRLVAAHAGGWLAQAVKRIYVEDGAAVRLRRRGRFIAHGVLRGLVTAERALRLEVGDTLVVCRDETAGRAAEFSADGAITRAARIGSTLGAAFDDIAPGHRILFDDGKLAGEVLANSGEELEVRITHTPPGGARLRSDKGINLPDRCLRLASLSPADLEHLDFAVAHCDMVGLSFVRGAGDVLLLEDELTRRNGQHLGVVLKIETRQGFEALPDILLASLRSPPVGIMIARGDLAAEIGFERLAEVQEEILWLCEAAHVPVIWATQVLETLAKSGYPSRAEVTDAAMGVRAECVMLNKGPYMVEAVTFLDGVLRRMQSHQHKKRAMLRRLAVAGAQ